MKNKEKSPQFLVQFLNDYLPIIVFFTVFKLSKSPQPLFEATIAIIATTFFGLILSYILTRKISTIALLSGAILGVFGGLTVWLDNDIFIKLKPTIVNLVFAAILFYGNFAKKPFLAKIFGKQIQMSDAAWFILAKRWMLFFIALAALNEFIWRNFSTDFWVTFKLFGMTPISLIFTISQFPFILREFKKFQEIHSIFPTEEQRQRYLRNIVLPEIGEEGQKKLLQAKVLVIGAGGLGSPVLFYLAAAGVGNIGVIDDDVVELSNLQRQVIHNYENLGEKKVVSAKQKISALNEDVKLEIYDQRATTESLTKIATDYDFIIDCTDNFPTRFIINEVCYKLHKPLIFAAVKGFCGQVSVFKSNEKNPCYACFNTNIIDENFSLPLSEKGILGSVAGTIGALQATTAINEILGISQGEKESLVGKILLFDFLKNDFRKVSLRKNPSCKICS